MEAKVKNEGEVTIITLKGSLDIEHTQPFREICLKNFTNKKVIFNMEGTSFVGSTGIQPFLETVRVISAENQHGLTVVGVKSEFRRIFQNMENPKLHIFETEATAIASFAIKTDFI